MFSKFLTGPQENRDGEAESESPFFSILTAQASRVEFALLVMLCANVMRQNLLATFDASQISSSSPAVSPGPSAESLRLGDDIEAPPSYYTATEGRGREAYDRRAEELSEPEVKELKRTALAYLNKWRIEVLRRMGEVLKVRSEVVLREKEKREKLGGLSEKQKDGDGQQNGHYAAVHTRLVQLEEDKRILLLNSFLLLLLSLEKYSAHSRVLLLHISASLRLPATTLTDHENKIAKGLLATAESQMSAEKETKKKATQNSGERAWKVGLATVAGAALIGVTGGLAAPLLAAGLGTVLGGLGLGATAAAGLLGSLAGNFVLIGGLFGAYGGRMTGRMMDQYAREVEDFEFVPLRRVSQDEHRLRVAIAVSGWLTEQQEVVKPWRVLGSGIEAFALRWELDVLLQLGTSLTAVLRSYAWDYAKYEIVRQTVLSTIAAGLWPLGLLKICRVADNPFLVAKARSDKAGEILADALINKAQGERPVILIGYSMGARLIYSCLQSLADRNAFGLVEAVILMGAPAPSDAADWRRIRSVVSGRVVNVYNTNDYILGLLYRTSSIQLGVAGLQKVDEVYGVENIDASSLVSGHTRYRYLIGAILQEAGFEDIDLQALEKEAETLRLMDEEEAAMRREKEKEQARRIKGTSKNQRPIRMTEADRMEAKTLSHEDIKAQVEQMKLQEERSQRAQDDASATDDQGTDEEEETRGITMIDAEHEAEALEKEVAAKLSTHSKNRKIALNETRRPPAEQDHEISFLQLAPEPELEMR